MPTFRLVMRSAPSLGKVFMLDKPELFVGRDLNNEIVINDPEVSRRHARFFIQGNNYYIEDLGSTNGTFIAGQRLAGPYLLRIGEVITFGERINVVYETEVMDSNVTMVGMAVQPIRQPDAQFTPPPPIAPPPPVYQPQAPVFSPAPQSVQPRQVQVPPPPPLGMGYAGQVPYQAAPPPPAKRSSKTLIILLILLIVFICLCVTVGLFFAPKEFWCLVPVWPQGACP